MVLHSWGHDQQHVWVTTRRNWAVPALHDLSIFTCDMAIETVP